MEIVGYLCAILVGVSLGLIGSGGSILTVPILVYLMGVSPVLATAYSLFIVGSTALVGGIKNATIGKVDFKTVIIFGIPSILSVYATRAFIVPNIPDTLTTLGDMVITKDLALMVLFAIVMILASYSMIKKRKNDSTEESQEISYNYPMIILEGVVVGLLTGLVGAGGGFLIIPALVLFSKLPMKMAVGTSLFIIALKSLIGFTGDIQTMPNIDYTFLLTFTALSVVGMFLGIYLTKFIDGKKLKKGFGWFVLVMGVYILLKELWY